MTGLIYALEEFGLIIKGSLKLNKWIATATRDKPNKKNGRYFYNGEVCFFKNWATGEQSYWSAKKFPQSRNNQQRAEYFAKLNTQRKESEAREKALKMQTINKAFNQIGLPGDIVFTHPYLESKQAFTQMDFKIDEYKRLIIPMYDCNNNLVGYQQIDVAGNKKFKAGSILKGAFYPIKPDSLSIKDLDVIFLCEGYATGSSIYQALNEELDAVNYGILCCMAATNIDSVYDAIISKFGRKAMVHIKDQDNAANKSKVRGFTVGFTPGQDANDIHCQFGLETLASIIKSNLHDLMSGRMV
ncbi:MAG: hypothetical protein ACK5Z5_02965 [Neisseriaceae bacterium]|jgi:putative DNA primase/helicase